MNTRSTKGFTLVEIMIVVVIIGLLAAMAIPAFQKVRQSSQDKAVLNNARQLSAAADQYFLENGVSSVASTSLIGATNYDRKLRAFDKDTGALLWETVLPNSGNATPVSYEVNGRQFAQCSCGAPFTQPREKVREDAIDRHLLRKHGGRGIRL